MMLLGWRLGSSGEKCLIQGAAGAQCSEDSDTCQSILQKKALTS